MKAGFSGLGTMGLPMAKCLQQQGIEVHGRDVNPAPAAPASNGYGPGFAASECRTTAAGNG